MNRTIVVRRDYLHFIKKYQRYEKRHTNISAHISPCFRCHEGDSVIIGQCRWARRWTAGWTGGVLPAAAAAALVGQGARGIRDRCCGGGGTGAVLWRGAAL